MDISYDISASRKLLTAKLCYAMIDTCKQPLKEGQMSKYIAVLAVALLSGCASIDGMFRGFLSSQESAPVPMAKAVEPKLPKQEFQKAGPVTPKKIAEMSAMTSAPAAKKAKSIPAKATVKCEVNGEPFTGDECELIARIKRGEVLPFPPFGKEAVIIPLICDAMNGGMVEAEIFRTTPAHYFYVVGTQMDRRKFLCVKDIALIPAMPEKEGYFARKAPPGVVSGAPPLNGGFVERIGSRM